MTLWTNGLLAMCALTAAALASTSASAQSPACTTITAEDFGIDGLVIDAIAPVTAGEDFAVGHCHIGGSIDHRTGIDGVDYAISFELRLPDDWNGNFVHQFNGGNDGTVVPATGPLLGGMAEDTALRRGYAVVSSDAGHRGDANPEAGLAGGARFGLDPQGRSDYGYGAVAKLHPVALDIVENYYGQAPQYVYGVGGSNGGRHAMIAAARMPDAFDGLLAGYPGFNLPKAGIQHAWDVQAFRAVDQDIKAAFTPDDLQVVADAILAACDDLDGLADGIVGDTDSCQAAFDIASVQCADGANGQCLSPAQVEALRTIHQGPVNSSGHALYSDWPWDIGIASPNWRFWKLESSIPPWNGMPLIAVMGSSSLAQIFTTPPTEVEGSPDVLEQYLLDFDFDTDAAAIYETAEGFEESAMEFMTPPGADNPELAHFRDAGGKLLVFHGVSDPVFSVNDTTEWYRMLDANNGDAAEKFAMFYRIPGMPHGAQSPATDRFDIFSALVDWVENGSAPEAVIAEVSGENEALADMAGASRKLCPYPSVARYTGDDPMSEASFTCQ
jgi:feruloyl esterase